MTPTETRDVTADKGDQKTLAPSHPHSSLDLHSNDTFNHAAAAPLKVADSTIKGHFGTPAISGEANSSEIANKPAAPAGTAPGAEAAPNAATPPAESSRPIAGEPHHLTFGNIFHNVLDVGATLAVGVKDAAVNTAVGVAHGVEDAAVATGHGIEHGAKWVGDHPLEAAGIAVVGVAAVAAEVVTLGGATPALAALAAGGGAVAAFATSDAVATTLMVVGTGLAAAGTVEAGIDVSQHGELSTLMNQQNMSPEQVQAARAQLKDDTGGALLNDSLLGAGLLVKGLIGARAAGKAVVVAESGSKAAQSAEGSTELAKNATDAAKLATNATDGSSNSLNLDQAKVSIQGKSLANSAHVEVKAATITHPDGTTSDAYFHSEEIRYGEVSPAATAERLQNEQASFKLNRIIGFDGSYPESKAFTATVNGKVNNGWLQEAAGKTLDGVLKERAMAKFGTLSQMNEDVPKILDSDPALRTKIEDAVVERVVYGDKDIASKNIGVSGSDGASTVRNFDMGKGFSPDVASHTPTISSFQESLTTIGLKNAMSGRPLSAETIKKLSDFAAQYSDAGGAARLSQSTGLSTEQTTGVLARVQALLKDGKLPTVAAKLNDPENIAFYRSLDN
jgi:hypothetical protein